MVAIIKHTPGQIIQNPVEFNKWLIANDALKILRSKCTAFSPPVGQYFLCDFIGGELWLCRSASKSVKKIVQVSEDCRRDYGDCYNGCYYLNWKK